ncbi:MAG: GDP-mannose 4,6-dehydratase [Ignavibacteria bacterium]|nr:GDP-mannose 4,6-dehydratase [Ignavibacteria bacterium]
MKKALITGITGQDGSYLAEFLLELGYEVHGIIRRASTFNTHRIDHIYKDPIEHPSSRLLLHYGDLSDSNILTEIIYNIQPDEIYHLGAQSHVRVSFELPEYTGNITGLGTTRILEAIRRSGIKTKFYQASSSELFGKTPPPQNENSTFAPQSPYAISKLYSYWMVVNYRNAYKLFASNGILFNHESPRRGEIFVTRKITRGLANVLVGKQKKIFLGNLDARRDWGYAPEYVRVMWKILQNDAPDDFVIGTGESHSVREFVEKAFEYCGIEIEWRGHGIEEVGLIKSFDKKWENIFNPGDVVIELKQKYFRPTEVDFLLADSTKAKKILGWEPQILFEDLVKIMVDYDLLLVGIKPKFEGYKKVKQKGLAWTEHKVVELEDIQNEV